MKIVMFYHSVRSDWNHGNAHFLRGVATELIARGHEVVVYEPSDCWSAQNLVAEHGREPLDQFATAYPDLRAHLYNRATLDLDLALDGADLVLVHEWNERELVRRIGLHRRRHRGYRLLFHDTHHRMVTDPQSMAAYALEDYDGVLAYGRVLRDLYLKSGRVNRAWTWHEAADVRLFRPLPSRESEGDLVWIGNWGDEERTAELHEFLLEPVRKLRARSRVFGVRYPEHARQALKDAGIGYGGWLPNFEVPNVFSRYRVTVHVPRRPYLKALPGIPTIRPFEALACGIPLICSPWDDVEGLFRPGRDFLLARSGLEMQRLLRDVLSDEALGLELAANGLKTIRARHTCAHRVDELMAISTQIKAQPSADRCPAPGEPQVPRHGRTAANLSTKTEPKPCEHV